MVRMKVRRLRSHVKESNKKKSKPTAELRGQLDQPLQPSPGGAHPAAATNKPPAGKAKPTVALVDTSIMEQVFAEEEDNAKAPTAEASATVKAAAAAAAKAADAEYREWQLGLNAGLAAEFDARKAKRAKETQADLDEAEKAARLGGQHLPGFTEFDKWVKKRITFRSTTQDFRDHCDELDAWVRLYNYSASAVAKFGKLKTPPNHRHQHPGFLLLLAEHWLRYKQKGRAHTANLYKRMALRILLAIPLKHRDIRPKFLGGRLQSANMHLAAEWGKKILRRLEANGGKLEGTIHTHTHTHTPTHTHTHM